MADRGVELADIELKTIAGRFWVAEGPFNSPGGAVDPAAADAAIAIGRIDGPENGLEDVQDRMMQNAVREIRQPEDLALFGLVDLKGNIGGCLVGLRQKHLLKAKEVGLSAHQVRLHARLMTFALAGLLVGQPEVIQAADLLV